MTRNRILAFTLIASVFVVTPIEAAFVYSVSVGAFTQNTGVQELTVFGTNGVPTDTVQGIALDFQVDNGGGFDAIPGTFGQPGQYGSGQLAGSSSFVVGPPNFASLSLDLNSATTFIGGPIPIATLRFDTNSLAVGAYTVSFAGTSTGGPQAAGPTFEYSSVGTPGAFTISAVPEPATLGLIGLGCVAAAGARRRFGRAKVTA